MTTLTKYKHDREIEILNSIDHKNIIKILDSVEDENNIYLILENLDYVDYMEYIKRKKISNVMMRQIIYEIMLGLKYIHDREIIHYDLKPENIMIKVHKYKENNIKKKKINIKIIDFGLSQYSFDILNVRQGTKNYLSPEVKNNSDLNFSNISTKIDIWGLGVIIYMSICKKIPYSNVDINDNTINHQDYLIFPKDTNSDIISFCKKCLTIDPDKRPDINELFLHPLVDSNENCNLNTPLFFPDPPIDPSLFDKESNKSIEQLPEKYSDKSPNKSLNNSENNISEPLELTDSIIERLIEKSKLELNIQSNENSSESYINSQTYDINENDSNDKVYTNITYSNSVESVSSDTDSPKIELSNIYHKKNDTTNENYIQKDNENLKSKKIQA